MKLFVRTAAVNVFWMFSETIKVNQRFLYVSWIFNQTLCFYGDSWNIFELYWTIVFQGGLEPYVLSIYSESLFIMLRDIFPYRLVVVYSAEISEAIRSVNLYICTFQSGSRWATRRVEEKNFFNTWRFYWATASVSAEVSKCFLLKMTSDFSCLILCLRPLMVHISRRVAVWGICTML